MKELFDGVLLPGETILGETVGVDRKDDGTNDSGRLAATNRGRIVFVNSANRYNVAPAERMRDARFGTFDCSPVEEVRAELRCANGLRFEGNRTELEELVERTR